MCKVHGCQISVKPQLAKIYGLDMHFFKIDMSDEARVKLKFCFAQWENTEKAEAGVRELIDQTPDCLGVRVMAYRFHFHRRHSLEAAHWALVCLDWLSARLGLPHDWRQVHIEILGRHRGHAYMKLWLQSLSGYACNLARLGCQDDALAVLNKVNELDQAGRVGRRGNALRSHKTRWLKSHSVMRAKDLGKS